MHANNGGTGDAFDGFDVDAFESPHLVCPPSDRGVQRSLWRGSGIGLRRGWLDGCCDRVWFHGVEHGLVDCDKRIGHDRRLDFVRVFDCQHGRLWHRDDHSRRIRLQFQR